MKEKGGKAVEEMRERVEVRREKKPLPGILSFLAAGTRRNFTGQVISTLCLLT